MSEWLYDHPISVPDMFEGAITKAIHDWLVSNEDQLLEKIASEIARTSVVVNAMNPPLKPPDS